MHTLEPSLCVTREDRLGEDHVLGINVEFLLRNAESK